MSDTTPTDLPSRRQLRESGMTGPIEIPTGPPLTRRERKMREQLEATGAIPVMTASTPVVDSPVTSDSPAPQPVAPPAPEPAAVTPAPATPAAVTPIAPESPPAATAEPTPRPLTRRELREQLRGKPVDVPPSPAPVVEQEPEDEAPAAIAPKPTPRVVDEEFSWQQPLDGPGGEAVSPVEVVAPAPAEPPAVLPPVFGTIPSGRDTPTAPARSVSTAAPATNALILPVAPSIDVTGPLGDTGEVLVTGNIPLPRLVAETAVTGVLDVDDDDDFMEADSGPYTAPISASLAVSSRSLELDQPMIQKPRVGAVSLALGVSAAILSVTAVSLLALALLTDIIQLPF